MVEDERRAFEALLDQDADLRAEVQALVPVVLALAVGTAQVSPPLDLRARVLTAATGQPIAPSRARADVEGGAGQWRQTERRASPWGWLAAAAALIAAVGLGVYANGLAGRLHDVEARLAQANAQLASAQTQVASLERVSLDAQSRLATLTAPDVAQVDLAGQPVAQQATARAWWSRSRGLVINAANLPQPPAGKTYQLWVVTGQAPLSAGLLTPDAAGRVNAFFATPPDIPQPVAMAVTLEPAGGMPAPTGDKYLVGLVGN